MKNKAVVNIHTYVALAIALLILFFDKAFAESFFLASLVFNVYLRLLFVNFSALQMPGVNPKQVNILVSIFSGLRVALAGIAIAVLIIKFTLNLYAALFAFVLYQLILIASGFFYASHHVRDSR